MTEQIRSTSTPKASSAPASKGAALRRLFASPSPIVIAGAHDGLTARLVEEAGFDGVWASGFEISASYGVPDASILTMTETLAAARAMSEATKIPVIADCDTAFGNAINAIRTVQAFEAAGVAGLCIEDNVFPKRCSFYPGVKRLLADTDEQALKIRAAVDASSKDFVVIARTEALIAGWGLEEALRRGRAYADAGADAVLIHSRHSTPDEIAQFADQWDRLTPLVCVPTTYRTITVGELGRMGFKMVIFANHGLRAEIRAIQETLQTLRKAGNTGSVEDRIVPLSEVYRLVNLNKMTADEQAYLPPDAESVKAVILAAGFDRRLMPLVSDRPKAMLEVKGKPILERQIDSLQQVGVRHIAVVRGYKKEQMTLPNVKYYDNDAFEESGEMESLLRAGAELSGPVVVMYGDILFDRNILERLLQSPEDITLVCDRSWPDMRAGREGMGPDLVIESPTPRRHHRFLADDQPVRVTHIGQSIDPTEATAEFIGMAKLSARGCQILGEVYRDLRERADQPMHESPSFRTAKLTDLLHEVIARGHAVASVGIYQGWLEVDTFDDYRRAWTKLGKQFLDLLERLGYNFFTGVPCSLFTGVTRILDDDPRYGYVSAVREDSAMGIAAGAYFGGRQPAVFMQNSGLGVSINALVSLNQIYDIPTLIIVSWRGQGGKDAPEHLVMGAIMEECLRLFQVPFAVFDPKTLERDVESLTRTMQQTGRPVALVVPKGMLQ